MYIFETIFFSKTYIFLNGKSKVSDDYFLVYQTIWFVSSSLLCKSKSSIMFTVDIQCFLLRTRVRTKIILHNDKNIQMLKISK